MQGTLGAIGGGLLIGQRPPLARAQEDARIEEILVNLPLNDKVAQMFMFEARGTTMTDSYAERLAAERPGGVIFVKPNIANLADVGPFVDAIHASNPSVPPLIGIDQEGGPVTRLPDDPAPSAPELGLWADEDVVNAAEARALYLRDFRFDVNFAPVADIAYDESSSMIGRTFGADPWTVAAKVAAMVQGSRRTRLLNAAKHFPGHGRTDLDSHVALPEVDVSLDEWFASDAVPFQAAVNAGVQMVMLGHLRYTRWDEAPTSLSKPTVDLLRLGLGFGGVVVTDDLGMAALADFDPFTTVDQAIYAGIDLLLYATPTANPLDLIAHLRWRVESGVIPIARIDDSVRRLLRLKVNRFGL